MSEDQPIQIHDHCWHTIRALLSHPIQLDQQCCWCGEKRRVPSTSGLKTHGKYNPNLFDSFIADEAGQPGSIPDPVILQ